MMTLLKVCEELSDEYHISFNATKCKHIYFSQTNSCHPKSFELCGNNIPTVECDKHLGNIICQDTFQKIVQASINELYHNVNKLLALFSKVMIDLFQIETIKHHVKRTESPEDKKNLV